MNIPKLHDAKALSLCALHILKHGDWVKDSRSMPCTTNTRCARCGQIITQWFAYARSGLERSPIHAFQLECTIAVTAISWLSTFERDIFHRQLSGAQKCQRCKGKRDVSEYFATPEDGVETMFIRICAECVR